ncbi:hypothetical protein V8F20_004318 [Naviculisporaceae sp. PSN 640]
MHLQNLFVIMAASLATLTTASPLPPPPIDLSTPAKRSLTLESIEAYLASNNITSTTGSYDPRAPLSKRQNVPSECAFESPRGGNFYYRQMTGIQGTACFGYTSPYCGTGTWQGQDFEDIQRVVNEQVTKDGHTQSSEVGRWSSTFFLFTSAFANRETVLFVYGLLLAERRGLWIYWSRDGDFLSVYGGPTC